MAEEIDLLIDLFESGKLDNCFSGIVDHDQVLDMREEERFESDWLRVHKALTEIGPSSLQADREAVDHLREVAFKHTYDLTESSDLSAFVSDDFELIALALRTEFNDDWLNALWLSYSEGIFPCDQLRPRPGRLKELVRLK